MYRCVAPATLSGTSTGRAPLAQGAAAEAEICGRVSVPGAPPRGCRYRRRGGAAPGATSCARAAASPRHSSTRTRSRPRSAHDHPDAISLMNTIPDRRTPQITIDSSSAARDPARRCAAARWPRRGVVPVRSYRSRTGTQEHLVVHGQPRHDRTSGSACRGSMVPVRLSQQPGQVPLEDPTRPLHGDSTARSSRSLTGSTRTRTRGTAARTWPSATTAHPRQRPPGSGSSSTSCALARPRRPCPGGRWMSGLPDDAAAND